MDLLLFILILAALASVALLARSRSKQRALREREQALAPVRKLAFEDVTALGVDLANLDSEISGHQLDEGSTADYQRALDTYDSAKIAGESLAGPNDIQRLTEIIEDGRYAIASVRARVAGDALPTRRPSCFFDPRHGLSVADVPYVPADGIERHVPACALDTERVRAGADPDTRKVLVGAARVPYWEGGRAYAPYAAGYFGVDALTWLFVGSLAFNDFGGGGHDDNSSEDSDMGDPGGDGGANDGFFDGGGDF